eukprot:TRINITY_DN6379_c0_g1_i1.p1 TRINITY_DN6379_c0_g1~~TRINITY_DN6379_c0_g1_i1.p1  ORF type:complete len:265 (-),score=43.58 TRINITY_DN6379_c0_g1_i1:113-907(-)
MFEAKVPQATLLKKILESLKDLVTECNFDCSPTGMALQAMDSSHVSLVSMLLNPDGFSEFRCERTMQLGISLPSFSKVLKCAGNDDTVYLKAQEGGDSIEFTFENPKQSKLSQFELKLLDIDVDALGIPETDYQAVIKMPSAEFQRICRDLAMLGDTAVISAAKKGVKFVVTGETGKGEITCKPTGHADAKEDEQVTINIEEPVSLTFALRYLNFFTKATSLSSTVTLSMSKDVPLMVEYPMVGKENDSIGHVRFYLAPKIEED